MNELKKITFYNADEGEVAKCILAGCYKFGAATLLRQNGSTMTSVIETFMKESNIIDKVIQVANIVDDTNIGFKNPQRGRVYSAQGISPAVYCFQGGNLEPKIVQTNMADKNAIELPSELKGKKFRIRKLTPKECFRLMGVDDKDIDKIQAAGVSNSGQYKLAGNSIVVDVLFHLFRKMFIEKDMEATKEGQQLSLF